MPASLLDAVVNVSSGDLWLPLYDNNYVERQPLYQYPRILPFTVPILLETPILAVRIYTQNSKESWFTGGWINQQIDVGSSGISAMQSESFRLPLNVYKLLVFPNLSPQYRLHLTPAPWLPDFELTIWQFTGAIGSELKELIEVLRVNQTRMEFKIDIILANAERPKRVTFDMGTGEGRMTFEDGTSFLIQ